MQPFGIPKNPKMTVQTRKQPPVQRYPNPYSTPSQPKANPVGSGQKKIGTNPFAEENNSTAFDIAQSFGVAGGFEESEGPLQTPERFNSDGFNQHHRGGLTFEETPAALARGGDLAGDEGGYLEDQSATENERNEPPQNVPMHNLAGSPDKRNLRGRDDDEYVRVESENELEEEPQIRNNNDIPRGTPVKLAKPAAFGSANKENVGRNTNPAGYEEDQRRTQHHGADADALLQIKRLELELAKERQRADFFEGEQNKLISENTELRRRTEELNARADLAKRYDTSERLAKKEEEVERLKIEVNSLNEERRMVEEHYHKLLNENRGFRTESDSLIFSIQEENRRLQEEVQNLRHEMDVRVGSKINIVNEKNVLLESEVTELRQQIQVLTDQLTLKANYDQKIAGFNQELDHLTANLSKTTSHTQTQLPPVHTQISQTSPTKIHAMETQTQAQGTNVELHEAQTSPIKFPEQGRPIGQLRPPSVQTSSPTRFDNQGAPKSATKSAIKISPSPSKPKTSGLNTPEIKTNPFGQPASGSKLRPPVTVEEVQVAPNEEEAQNTDFLDSFKVEGEENVETPAYIPENVRNSPLYPPRAQASAPDDEESEDEIKQEDRPLQIQQQDERPPIAINRSPLLRSPQQNLHPPVDHQEKPSPTIPSPGPGQANLDAGGARGLMGVPQYKVPQRPVPKKPAGFKPMGSNPFANEGENVVEQSVPVEQSGPAEQIHEELPPPPQREDLVHHFNPTTDQQEPIHSTFEEKPPVMAQNNDEMPPPRNLMGVGAQTRVNAPNNIPINRPPLFNAQHKGKTQKIGRNPFSTEEPSTTSPALKVEETFEEQKQIPQPSYEQHPPSHESNEILNEAAAENFFDQLAGGHPPIQQQTQLQVQIQRPPITTTTTTTTQPFRPGQPRFPVPGANPSKLTTSVSSLKRGGANPFAEEEAPKTENTQVSGWGNNSQTLQSSFTQQDTTADLSKSFQSEEKPPEAGKMVVGKAVALKKKKAALPGNMFD